MSALANLQVRIASGYRAKQMNSELKAWEID